MKQIEFSKTLNILSRYGLKFVDHKVISNEDDIKKLSYPVVMKVLSEKVVHKSDKGGVILGISNIEDAFSAFKKLKKISDKIIVQNMVKGKEIIIGMKRDAQFGPVIMLGLGGIFVEVLKDVSFRVCPIDKEEANLMIKELKSYKILEGVRGEKGVNISAIADIIVKVSKLALSEKISEMDLNPVIVNEKEATLVDVRFMV
jgi:acetyl-CoA synthetase (ADP-forming)